MQIMLQIFIIKRHKYQALVLFTNNNDEILIEEEEYERQNKMV
jgi:hypothetical protein